jgi:ribosomal protein S18 acetylase RimI-like enzyme
MIPQKIQYKINAPVSIDEIIEVLISSGINRPVTDRHRIKRMFDESNVIITAWHEFKLVGVSRALTDFSYCCYLSDLAVSSDYQKQGIGKEMVDITKNHIGDQCMLLLLAAPSAMDYYPKIGMEKIDTAFMLKRNC